MISSCTDLASDHGAHRETNDEATGKNKRKKKKKREKDVEEEERKEKKNVRENEGVRGVP